MGWFSSPVARYGIDGLIALSVTESALALGFGRDRAGAPHTPVWFSVAAPVGVALPLLLRRRFPFGGPCLVWLLAAVVSLVDGRIVAFPVGTFLAGMIAALLLGNLED